ncbi:MAG: 50S ribosomal protein L17 [Treponema sp.]|nr:50S ribosomal protein L17 [Treponema sp.]
MKHRRGFNPLERMASHRKALHRNMVTSLFRYERIRTTKTKALAIRRSAEKLITRAKDDTVHNRRIVSSRLFDEGIVAKLFLDIAQRMKERPGGYTRIIKLGARPGDAAEIVILELVDYKLDAEGASDKKAKKNEKKEAAKETKKRKEKKSSAGKKAKEEKK